MTTSLQTLQQACAQACGWYNQVTPSATGANTYTWVADGVTSVATTDDQDAYYQYVYARVESDSAGSPQNVGEVRRVSAYTASTSTFTLNSDRGFSNSPTTTMTIGLYKTIPPLYPNGQDTAMDRGSWRWYINRTLRNLRYRRYSLLTLVTDGDMEATGTTNWTASNSTLSKVTTAANVSLGARSLRVLNSSANGYARSALVPVTYGDAYCLRADLRVNSGTAVLEAYDETNGASLQTQTTTSQDQRYLWTVFWVPSGCHNVSVRLKGTEASADIYWDCVSLRHQLAHRLPLPSWIDRAEAFEWLGEYYANVAQANAYLAAGQGWREAPDAAVLADWGGATAFYATYRFRPRDEALLLVRGLSAYDELSATSDTTTCPQDWVVTGAALAAAIDLDDEKLIARFAPRWKAYQAHLPRRLQPLAGVFD